MQTDLAPHLANTAEGLEAQKLLSNCVHCGFCTATCPTYQLLGDELDGPRGRIYLIKQMAEGKTATEKTRTHLDRCLTCRNCESTCPSGVQYGHLLDIGRKWAEEQAPRRSAGEQVVRWLLKEGLTRPSIFNTTMKVGRVAKPFLPKLLQKKIPDPGTRYSFTARAPENYTETMLLLEGCVQPGMLPNINQATKRVFGELGVRVVSAPNAGCCGAIRFHLNDHDNAKADMRRNIDAWWPMIQEGLVLGGPEKISAIVMNASGCGVTVKDYGHLLKDDVEYAGKAKIISSLCKDLSEVLPTFTPQLVERLGNTAKEGVIYHPPCTLQHGQQIRGKVEATLTAIGVAVNLCADSHLCCGSAGSYSILQSNLSEQLRNQKLTNLKEACATHNAKRITSANVGCITHLANDDHPVLHWIEVIDELLLSQPA